MLKVAVNTIWVQYTVLSKPYWFRTIEPSLELAPAGFFGETGLIENVNGWPRFNVSRSQYPLSIMTFLSYIIERL
jgi:hypothetical protein